MRSSASAIGCRTSITSSQQTRGTDDEKEMDTVTLGRFSGVRRHRRLGRARTVELAPAVAPRREDHYVLAGVGHPGAESNLVRRFRRWGTAFRRQTVPKHVVRAA